MNDKEISTGSAARLYVTPQVSVTEIEVEGVLCESGLTGFGGNSEGYGDGGTTDF